MKKKKCVAMLLAGGQGTRLHALTAKVAKPAVSYGSKYRIIDFTLSNCANSDIDTVGVLTQYQPMILNEYVGNGQPWDLDYTYGGAYILPPYQAKEGAMWYKGTANAIYQNINFLNRFDSEHVLILGGDHIYRMDYAQMLGEHTAKDADCTIAVIDVSPADAPKFGIMDFDKTGRITSFEEKPVRPKSNHASMGVYIFKKDVLVRELTEDEADAKSVNDFGRNIIPNMLKKGMKLFAHSFHGYWRDVGTVSSLWQANMDLLGESPAMDLYNGKIFSRNQPLPPLYIGEEGSAVNSLCTAGCRIYGKVVNSVLSEDVKISKGSVVENSVIMRGASIGRGTVIRYAVIDEDVTIGENVTIGDDRSGPDNLALIGRGSNILKSERIASGEMIE